MSTFITTQVSSEPGHDMYWDDHLVVEVEEDIQEDTPRFEEVEKVFRKWDFTQHEDDFGFHGVKAFEAYLAQNGLNAKVHLAKYLFLGDG